MGRHVIKHVLGLEDASRRIDVFTRYPMSKECGILQGLAPDRIRLFRGDVEDEVSLGAAMRGTCTVFCNTNYWSNFQKLWLHRSCADASDPRPIYRLAEDAEVHQGETILELARKGGVEHFVYSSLDAVAGPSQGRFRAPHFDAKARVEEFIERRRADTPWYADKVTVLVTAPYIENFKSSRMFRGGGEKTAVVLEERQGQACLVLCVPIGTSPWPMVALDDIGWFAAHVIDRPKEWAGRTLKIASDRLSMEEVARVFRRVTGISAVYEPYTLSDYRDIKLPESDALANMFGFITEFGITRDFVMLRKLKGDLWTFEKWLRSSGWKGGYETVQKELTTEDNQPYGGSSDKLQNRPA
jgi:hypothetical protein